MGDLEKGLAECQKALEIDPQFGAAHYNVGNVWFVRGRFDKAIDEYQKALTAKPEHAEARYHLGLALAVRGRNEQAMAEYRRRLELAVQQNLRPLTHALRAEIRRHEVEKQP